MRRREFISLVGGTATWPLVARAQQPVRMRRIGVLVTLAENDVQAQVRVRAFEEHLAQLGWTNGRNIRIDYRWADDLDRVQGFAKELVHLAPDAIVCQGTPSVRALREETATIPIVFVQVTDPVSAGFVTSLAHPGGNVTGFAMYEPNMGTKWLGILKEIAPAIKRVAIIFNPDTAPGRGSFFIDTIEAGAPKFGVQSVATPIHDAAAIERSIDRLAREPNGSLFVMPDITTEVHREFIVSLAARYRMPAIYSQRFFVESGGLISYGIDTIDLFRQGATYVDRILRGEKPSLPVQGPIKFEMAINRKTAKALGIEIPPTLLALADELIE
jgi:putative tryptophan/tyrosine transport system substrate-binding protein